MATFRISDLTELNILIYWTPSYIIIYRSHEVLKIIRFLPFYDPPCTRTPAGFHCRISVLLLTKSWTFWYTECLPTSSYTGVTNFQKWSSFYRFWHTLHTGACRIFSKVGKLGDLEDVSHPAGSRDGVNGRTRSGQRMAGWMNNRQA